MIDDRLIPDPHCVGCHGNGGWYDGDEGQWVECLCKNRRREDKKDPKREVVLGNQNAD